MLQKVERYVLKTLSKHPNDINIEIEKFHTYSADEIRSAMHSLKDKGYLEMAEENLDSSIFHYSMSTQGRFYKEYRFQSFVSNIFIPIVVSIITTLITSFFCG